MRVPAFLRLQLLLICSCLLIFGVLLASDYAIGFSAPTQQPPSGNPTLPPGPKGDKGPAGDQGNQGNTGAQGAAGPKGPTGTIGSVPCNWSGNSFYVSNGWDIGACQFYRGMWITCDGNGQTSYFSNFDGNGCNYYQP